MRRLLPLLAATAVLACGASMSGNYQLVSVGGAELPAAIRFETPRPTTITHTSGSLTLTSGSTFRSTLRFYEDDRDPETGIVTGTFTVDDLNVIRFTPGPDSESDPFEGTWEGKLITIPIYDQGALVFRR